MGGGERRRGAPVDALAAMRTGGGQVGGGGVKGKGRKGGEERGAKTAYLVKA